MNAKMIEFPLSGRIRQGFIVATALGLSGCAGIAGAPSLDSVHIVTAEQLGHCRNVGSVHVAVVDSLPQLQSVEGAVAEALLKLAKQSTLQLGGNALVEMSNISAGSQSFEAFDCPG